MPLSKRQMNDLEDAALIALGRSPVILVNGFRVMGDKGQVAAIYWSDNNPGNDVEIALCDIRLSDHYDLRFVRRWIAREQKLAGRDCNVHKHGSDWPILGFSYDSALAFLDRCRRLRKGVLDHQLVNELRTFEPELGDRNENLELALARLRPTSKKHVIDLVKLAGVDVRCWYKTSDDKLVKNPRSNPAYCFNWSFGGNGEPVVVCLWHSELKIDKDTIVYIDNLREHSKRLQEVANTAGEEQDIRNRAQTQARRANALDEALASAWSSKKIVRVIVNEGLQRPADSLGKESSKVETRELDVRTWHVEVYDEVTGHLRLVRNDDKGQLNPPTGTRSPSTAPTVSALEAHPQADSYADQYTIASAEVRQTDSTGSVYSRSRAVRDAALKRASGACELCGQRGFVTKSGTIYLETHHVRPLSEGGADSEDNVVALCPDDHRKAHYGIEAAEIQMLLLANLADFYPIEVNKAA